MPPGVEPGAVTACAAGRGVASLTPSGEVRRETSGASTALRATAGGDKSRSEKRETWDGVSGAVPPPPRARVQGGGPAPHAPVVAPHTHRSPAAEAVPSPACGAAGAA